MKGLFKVFIYFFLGLIIMGGFYYYLEEVYFAPTSEFTVTSSKGGTKNTKEGFEFVGSKVGDKYYSKDKKYMAIVEEDAIKIYTAGHPNDSIDVNLGGKKVSFFEWLNDRDLAILGLYGGDNSHEVILEQFNPESPDHKVDTKISELPSDSKIKNIVYSTATNVIYMKVQVGKNAYRIYRTDANYDTRRIYVQATDIGRIAVFYDKDLFFYDNLKRGTIYSYNDHEGSWRVISPSNGRYLLIGLDKNDAIYAAKVNRENKVLEVFKGRLGVGFERVLSYDTPRDMVGITVDSVVKELSQKGVQ